MTKSPDYRKLFIGLDQQVPLLDGSTQRYINFDNAASTPSMQPVKDAIDRLLPYYSSVHRGTGFKSLLSTWAYDHAREVILDFVGADPKTHTVIFGKNTTEAVNKLAHRFPAREGRDVVLVSLMEHHSNDLPWRCANKVIHIGTRPNGSLDEDEFDRILKEYGKRIALVSISGASNVTGFINPIHRLAEKTHQIGAQIAVDCAQLAPHRKIKVGSLDDPAHLDYIFISGHKMYAPFGSGALIGRLDTFEQGDPDLCGGGQVEIVTLDDVVWTHPPEKDEAGSPNVVGAVALSAAILALDAIGMEKVAAHEVELTHYLLERLPAVDGLTIYGDRDPGSAASRLGVVPVNFEKYPHALVSAILGYEFGIGVRHGCFCAHPYMLSLLGVSKQEAEQVRDQVRSHDKRSVPGLVRISFGLYNETGEIDALLEALGRISRGEFKGEYTQGTVSGEYRPTDWSVDFERILFP
ncbi:MAG: aminotransferase class V-fold PLP-dependent enzyme [Anaerolineaceae bacterium]|nr:aminotransferase class V-fold PLP-dependent enzyme [Anaerolineaceae bacterium]MBN2676453.1 aminotransferase class V-fold PLP-dependent enzyme [Anaerolineaceae bacterium]